MKAHLVGGGLASLAAAASLIRDGGVLANNIFVYEASERLGGCLGIPPQSPTGYVLPSGRIFENEYQCAFELFSIVPSASNPQKSIKEEILEFNRRHGSYDKTHIIDGEGKVIKSSHFWLKCSRSLRSN